MFLKPECAQCILDDIMEAAASYQIIDEKFVSMVLDIIKKEFYPNRIPSELITEVHRVLKKRLKKEILFEERRKKANKYAMEAIKYIINKDSIPYTLEMAARANGMDFRSAGIGYKSSIDKGIASGNIIGSIETAINLINSSSSILYVLDNVGEIVFDKLFIENLINEGKEVTCIAKGGAITSDAIKEDLEYVGFYNINVKEIILTRKDTLGLQKEDIEIVNSINADLIISKGQANFYFFNAYKSQITSQSILCLFSTKCDLVASLFNARKGDIIIKKL